jgi:hypothetical protein
VNDVLLLTAVIAAYAVVQSVFGVGLLVFGTPTLLLLGFSFEEVLAYLLPCSLAISILQVWDGGLTFEAIRRRFLFITVPFVVIGAVIALGILGGTLNIKLIVGVMLLVTAILRFSARLRNALRGVIIKRLDWFLGGMGFIHGLSNLGGGILTVIVGSLYEQKTEVRRHIAFAYGLMAISQLIVLYITSSPDIIWQMQIVGPLLALAISLTVGSWAFGATPAAIYQRSLTVMIGLFGTILIVTS